MSLEKIYQLKPDESQLLYSGVIDDKKIEVRQWQEYRWLHLGDESVQTLMITDAVDQIVLPNIKALLAVLLFCPEPKRMLNFGLGGASLERFLDTNRPELTITSVESNQQIIKLAKEYFQLPESINVVHDTAEEFIAVHSDSYDIILCDLFIADTQASCLYNKRFYANISRSLDKAGVIAINILPESEEDVVNVLLPIKDYFDHIYLLEFPDYSNAIIFASCKRMPNKAVLLERAGDIYQKTKLDLRDIPDRINIILETV